MRRVSRLSQPLLAAASSPQCTCTPSTLPIVTHRALSTTPTLNSRQGVRKALWRGGDAPGPEDVDDPAVAKSLRDQQIARNFEDADATIKEWAAKEERRRQQEEELRKKGLRHVPKTSLKTKNERTWAPTQASLKRKNYVAATTTDGLEEIGGLDGWWDQPGNWGEENQYVGFSARSLADKVEDGNVCEALVRQAFVEALVVGQLDRKALKVKWVPANRKDFNRATAISLRAFEAGGTVSEAQKEAAAKIARLVLEFGRTDNEGGDIISPKEAKALVEAWDPKWKAMPLPDPLVKFALNKRIYQLTGHLIPDAKLAQMSTVGNFIAAIRKPAKPTKVAEAIVQEGSLLELSNVKVSSRRVTPIDKEIALGRWKVIKEELEKRELPVTGHEHLPRQVQRNWIQGKP